MSPQKVTTLFLDIGGVFLTNGWDHNSRAQAAVKFGFPYAEMSRRHDLTFGTYEEGKITLEEYLDRVVFFKERPFTVDEFRDFMFAQSQALPDMFELTHRLKLRYKLKTVAISNEGRELNDYRIRKFGLTDAIDFFCSSCYIRMRKPDADVYRLALDMAGARASEVVYLENTEMFVDVARGLGIPTIFHRDYETTVLALAEIGLGLD
jgi:putative hydrolase of the HAD superfamily